MEKKIDEFHKEEKNVQEYLFNEKRINPFLFILSGILDVFVGMVLVVLMFFIGNKIGLSKALSGGLGMLAFFWYMGEKVPFIKENPYNFTNYFSGRLEFIKSMNRMKSLVKSMR